MIEFESPTPEGGFLQVAVSEAPPKRLCRHDLRLAGDPDTALRLIGTNSECRVQFLVERKRHLKVALTD